MPGRVGQLTLLLPERRRFPGQALGRRVSMALGRGDRLADVAAGEAAQLQRHFDVQPPGWPMAAITREADLGDAAGSLWLRADPVFVRPDINGARLMAWGNLDLSEADSAALVLALQPVFEDDAICLSPGSVDRWYLRVPAGLPFPEFSTPLDGLGEDLRAHLPEGEQGRRWRQLLNEAQIILHNHPVNARRVASGQAPANSLWFWGGGGLPQRVSCAADAVIGADDELRALAALACASPIRSSTEKVLVDLRRERDWSALEIEHLLPALQQVSSSRVNLFLDFADGAGWRITARQAWRFWRPALQDLQR